MTRRMTMLLAGALTAFVMVIMLGVGLTVAFRSLLTARAEPSPTPAADVVTTQPIPAPASNAAAAQPSLGSNAMATRLSANQATQIATSAVRNAQLLRAPELVNYKAIVAYEIALKQGNVYVDANTGKVLFNGAAMQPSQVGAGQPRRSGPSQENGDDDD